ncbi:MAG TPA: HAMP domain-containing sensor histidine kinase, partial [Ramlibacter sp.]|nr:HAMP domain-containing sensor histidine kinase [Ramlibacter sp.]
GRGLAVQWQPMALHEAVADVLEDLRQAFEGRRIDHVQVGSGACTADPDRVGQLVGNLVRNALAYGRASTPVTVQTETGDGQWLVSVHNFGDPIPPELQAGLFRPMVRGTHQASASRSIGLGLYIVSEIAKALGGSVSVTSTAEAGTTFTLRCPAGRS